MIVLGLCADVSWNPVQNVMLKPHKLREPLSNAGPWKQPCRVFVNSMSDLFHEQIPDEYIDRVFAVMWQAGDEGGHTFQVLTKRPERMRDYILSRAGLREDPPSNVWLGTSIENRKWVGRADVLRETPAAVRFISAEPLLGSLSDRVSCPLCRGDGCWDCGDGWVRGPDALDLRGIDWLIVGGESGSGHRLFNADWARDLRDACAESETAFFMKQMGGSRPGTKLEDLPVDLRIREFPVEEKLG